MCNAEDSIEGESVQHLVAALSPDGVMPRELPDHVNKVLSAFDADVRSATVNVSRTYTNEFTISHGACDTSEGMVTENNPASSLIYVDGEAYERFKVFQLLHVGSGDGAESGIPPWFPSPATSNRT